MYTLGGIVFLFEVFMDLLKFFRTKIYLNRSRFLVELEVKAATWGLFSRDFSVFWIFRAWNLINLIICIKYYLNKVCILYNTKHREQRWLTKNKSLLDYSQSI